MSDVITSCGRNSGKIWMVLNAHGPLKKTKLLEETELNDDAFYSAVGWLARENKIYTGDDTYMLGETNLTVKIGNDAGKVWKVLEIWGDVDITSISRLARIDEKDVYSALGWLACENKISVLLINKKNKKIKYRLK